MRVEELREDVRVEFASLARIIQEIKSALELIGNSLPDAIQLTAVSAFASQFYTGVENVLKRISRYNNIELPTSSEWQNELFKRFCRPAYGNLPLLFDEVLAKEFIALRKFRHYFFHGYSFDIEWDWIHEGIVNIDNLYERFEGNVMKYLDSL